MTRFDNLMGKLGKKAQAKERNDLALEQTPQTIKEHSASTRKKRGKRNDPSYTQVTAYIKKETHYQVKLALLQEGSDREFSELVEDLLTEYLRTQQLNNSKS